MDLLRQPDLSVLVEILCSYARLAAYLRGNKTADEETISYNTKMSEAIKQQNILFRLLRSAVLNEPFSRDELSVDEMQMEALVKLAKKHDLLHLVAYELEKDPTGFSIHQELKEQLAQSKFSAIFRYNRQARALYRISALFEQAQIDFIPLKGSVLREYYPQPWMRTSSDIDLLVHPEDMERAIKLLESEGYQYFARTDHDRSYVKENVHIELHFATIVSGPSGEVLQEIWKWAEKKDGWRYQHILKPEMFVFYHVAHMAKHFLVGGCGIRSFLDLKIIEDQMPYDHDKVSKLLADSHLETFMESSAQLADYWFGNQTATAKLQLAEEYILKGGTYGNIDNGFSIKMAKWRNKGRFFLFRFFLPFNEMKLEYPALERVPVLLPLFWAHRWLLKLFNAKKRREAMQKMNVLRNLSTQDTEQVEAVLTAVGLEWSVFRKPED